IVSFSYFIFLNFSPQLAFLRAPLFFGLVFLWKDFLFGRRKCRVMTTRLFQFQSETHVLVILKVRKTQIYQTRLDIHLTQYSYPSYATFLATPPPIYRSWFVRLHG